MTIIEFLSSTKEIKIVLEEKVAGNVAKIEWELGRKKRIVKVGRKLYGEIKLRRKMLRMRKAPYNCEQEAFPMSGMQLYKT